MATQKSHCDATRSNFYRQLRGERCHYSFTKPRKPRQSGAVADNRLEVRSASPVSILQHGPSEAPLQGSNPSFQPSETSLDETCVSTLKPVEVEGSITFQVRLSTLSSPPPADPT